MTEVRVTPMEPNAYGVEVQEGDIRTGHRIHVREGFWDEFGLPELDEVRGVREAVLFLLDREPGTAIPDELSLDEVARQYPDFSEELLLRLTAA